MMKVLTKNSYKFATGMFWQIPDEGKRSINFSKLVKETRHNMYCQVNNIKPTWGFCRKEELKPHKKVASLGKFIVEASKLSESYANSIICFKFKEVGEVDESGNLLKHDLYGYIVLLNGTICPDDGEYVSTFEMVKESIIQKARKHEIETLYLPIEVANQFFNIFERLDEASNNDDNLLKIIQNVTPTQVSMLREYLAENFLSDHEYFKLLTMTFSEAALLKKLIKEPSFLEKLKYTRDITVKYLIPNIYQLALTSDEIYWHTPKFKANYNRSLIHSIASISSNRYKLFGVVSCFVFIGYFGYINLFPKVQELTDTNKPVKPKAVSVDPARLINSCLIKNNRYFGTLPGWVLDTISCNSLGADIIVVTDQDMTLHDLITLANDKNAVLNGQIGKISEKYVLAPGKKHNIDKSTTISILQEKSSLYKMSLNLPNNVKYGSVIKFSLTSTLSPLFLLNHQVFNNLNLTKVNGKLNKATGFYTWTIEGEI